MKCTTTDNITQQVQENLERITDSVESFVQQSADTQEDTRSAILALSTATISLQLAEIESDFKWSEDAKKRDRWLETYIQWAIRFIDDCRNTIISDTAAQLSFVNKNEIQLGSLIELATATINNQKLIIQQMFKQYANNS